MGLAMAVAFIVSVVVVAIFVAEIMDMLTDNKHSWWCKIGSHSWTYTHDHNDNPSMPAFTCKQCGKVQTWT